MAEDKSSLRGVELVKATDGKHKWVAVFADGKRVPFGAVGYEDFTQHHNHLRRENYLIRHKTTEDWNNPRTAGALSRHLLWGDSPSLAKNLASFRRRFSLA